MTLVWDRFPGSGSSLLAMLAFADWANDEGSNIHPSMATLANKIRLTPRQARRVVHELIDQGFIEVVANPNGGAPGTTRHYRILLENLQASERRHEPEETGDTGDRGDAGDRGDTSDRDGGHGRPRRGTPMSANPSISTKNHQSTPHNPPRGESGKKSKKRTERTKRPAVCIKTFMHECKERGEKPIPPEDKVFEYAASVGIPEEWLHLCWLEFVERNIESGKRYKDWRQVFRNCVRSNWYRLWWAKPDGEMGLTTQGAMARKKHMESAA